MENAIPATTKKGTSYMRLSNGTYLKFYYKFKKNATLPYIEISRTDKHYVTKTTTKFTFKIFRMACKSLQVFDEAN